MVLYVPIHPLWQHKIELNNIAPRTDWNWGQQPYMDNYRIEKHNNVSHVATEINEGIAYTKWIRLQSLHFNKPQNKDIKLKMLRFQNIFFIQRNATIYLNQVQESKRMTVTNMTLFCFQLAWLVYTYQWLHN